MELRHVASDRAGRQAELSTALTGVRDRIAAACAAAGRAPDAVTLVAVTKTYPAHDVVLLAELGVTDVGENRDQEAAGKAAEVARLREGVATPLRWHFVGQLQRNKCRSVVGYAEMVHSVDSVRLARALGSAAGGGRERPLDVLVQISVDGDPARGGALTSPGAHRAVPDRAVEHVAAAVAGEQALRLAGVMAVAPREWEPEAAFARLAEVTVRLRAEHPGADVVSAGMSGDLEAAVRYGATHVRVGSALLGMRKQLR